LQQPKKFMTTHELIKAVRCTLNLSQEQMAGLLRMNRGHYSMAELGKRELTTASFIKVMEIFNTLTPVTAAPTTTAAGKPDMDEYLELLYKLKSQSEKTMNKLSRLREEKSNPIQQFEINIEALADTNHLDEGWMLIVKSNQNKPKTERNYRKEEIALRLQVLSLEAQIEYLETVVR